MKWCSQQPLTSRYWLCVLAVALLIRLLWIHLFPAVPATDFLYYFQGGESLSQGEGYRLKGELTAFWPVGYPFFLSLVFRLFGVSVFAAQAANIVLYLVAMVLAIQLAKTLFQSPAAARFTGILMALWPNHVAYSALTSNESLFLPLLLGTCLWFYRVRNPMVRALGVGLLAALACYVKPQALFFPILLYGEEWLRLRAWPSLIRYAGWGLLVYLCLGLVHAPWLLRNHQLFDEWVFVSTNGGLNLYIGNMEGASGTFELEEQHPEVKALKAEPNEALRSKQASKIAKEAIAADPVAFLSRIPRKWFHLMHKDVEGLYWCREQLPENLTHRQTWLRALSIPAQGVYLVLLALFLYTLLPHTGVWQVSRGWIGPLFLLYLLAIYAVFFGSTRFHFPLIPFMIMPVGAWLGTRGESPCPPCSWYCT